jgi:hypothetical protein
MEARVASAQGLDLDRLGENYLRNRLGLALVQLQLFCWLPGCSPWKKLDIITMWPKAELLQQLHSVVMDVFMTQRRRMPHPYWKAYARVNKMLPKLRLVRTVDQLVRRARKRLNEAGETYLMRLNHEAHKGSAQAQQLLNALQKIKENVIEASKIKWENYEQLLFREGNKPNQLACGDLAGTARLRCYARALEILADDLRYERFRPFLEWIAYIGYPDYPKVPGDKYTAISAKESEIVTYWLKREQTKLRVVKHRLKKRQASKDQTGLRFHSAIRMCETDSMPKISRRKSVTHSTR